MIRLYAAAGTALVLLALLAGVYVKGRGDGRAVQAAEYAEQIAEAAQRAAQEREALQAALDARTAELARKSEEVANAVEAVRVEYLPGKVIVKREVVRDVRYRDCVVTPGVRDTINAALAGRPVPGAVASPGDAGLSL